MQNKLFTGILSSALLMALNIQTLYANDTEEPVIKKHEVIVLKTIDDDGNLSSLKLDSDDNNVFVSELADGESKTISTSSGEVVTIGKQDGIMSITKNGETITLPKITDSESGNIKVMRLDGDDMQNMDIDIDMEMHMPEGLTISSSRELDQTTQDTIRAAIANSGIQDDVHFSKDIHAIKKTMIISDNGEMTELNMDGADIQEFVTKDGKQIKIIKKHIDIDK